MRSLCLFSLLALAATACRTMPNERAREEPPPGQRSMMAPIPPISGYSQQQNQPYSGYPGPVSAIGARAADAGALPLAAPADAGPPPPDTAMPAARPLYPESAIGAHHAGAHDGGAGAHDAGRHP
ncbi:Hypothetical protein A7982_11493 [Minicystis rosea]|nr:Hypothetical protein A7982_11493 [Minicystis rosea]